MITIADAINLRNLPPFRLRARMKRALKELENVGYLKQVEVDKSGIVRIKKGRQPITKPRGT